MTKLRPKNFRGLYSELRKQISRNPMTPSAFTWRLKMTLKKNGLPEKRNVHSLRHSNTGILIAGGTGVATVAVG